MHNQTYNFVPVVLHKTQNGIEYNSLSAELFKNRKIFLVGEVNEVSMGILMQSLMVLDQTDDKEHIELYINSAGGQTASGVAVYRYMTEQMQSPVHTYCIGLAASTASIIYLAGSERYIYEGTTIGLHYPSGGASAHEKPDELKGRLALLERTNDMICRIIAARTGHSAVEVSETIKNGISFGAQEALDYGLATQIVRKDALDYHSNPFISRPGDESDRTKRGFPPPTERYHTDPDNVIIPAVPKSLLHVHRKDNTTVFRFGFSYRFNDDGRTVYANTDITPSQTMFENFKYNLDLGAADRKYECELSDGSGTIVLTAAEIAGLYTDSRNKYLANKVRRSALANQ